MKCAGLACLLALGTVPVLPRESEARATRWHADVDTAYLRGVLGYVAQPLPLPQCAAGACTLPAVPELHVVRLGGAIGYGVFSLEVSHSIPVKFAVPYVVWSAGFRLESSTEAPIGLALRCAYLETHINRVYGRGGRAGLSFLLRFHPGVVLYAEAQIEVSTVTAAYVETGTLLSYTPTVGGGLRMSLR